MPAKKVAPKKKPAPKKAASKSLELSGVLDGYAVKDLHKKLLKAVNAKQLVVDMAKVTRVDTLACQVLVAAQKTCAENGVGFDLVNVPKDVKKSIETLGLGEFLFAEGV